MEKFQVYELPQSVSVEFEVDSDIVFDTDALNEYVGEIESMKEDLLACTPENIEKQLKATEEFINDLKSDPADDSRPLKIRVRMKSTKKMEAFLLM